MNYRTSPSGKPITLGLPPTPTIETLEHIPTTRLAEGTLVFVQSVEDIYALDFGDHTPDGVDVIAALGGGYWLSRFYGRWDDLQGDISEGVGNETLTYQAYRDTQFNMFFMRSDQDDALNFRYQMPHEWDPTTSVSAHLHVVPMANPAVAQNVLIQGSYVWTSVNGIIPAQSGWTSFERTMTVNPGGAYQQRIASIGTIAPPAGAVESEVLLIHFIRAGTNPGDTYDTPKDHGTPAANLGLVSADLHYRKSKIGTLTPFPEG